MHNVCVYVYVCICIYIYIYTHMYTYMYICRFIIVIEGQRHALAFSTRFHTPSHTLFHTLGKGTEQLWSLTTPAKVASCLSWIGSQ